MGTVTHTRVLIVGAGFSGLGMGIALSKSRDDDFIILEKADEVGGTWRDNTYPGCACDVPTHLYSYSFEPRSNWRRLFSYQPEIQQYLLQVADRYDLRRHIHFETTVTGGHWDADESRWHVYSADGSEYVAQFVVSAIGALHLPSIPEFPGTEDFRGARFHSAQWDHRYDLTGKRVAVIGTGASAIQFIPEIIERVGTLQVYQRTAPWVLPRANVMFTPTVRLAFARVPLLRRAFRAAMFVGSEVGGFAMNYRPELLRLLEVAGRAYIRREIADPELRRKVTPNYLPGCKRLLGSDNYYQAIADPKTELITEGIQRITNTGIVTADGVEHQVDAIIYGTGFHVIDSFESLRILGLGGEDLAERFQHEGVQAHRGITVAGMPNAFFLLGPNTGLGHTSIIYMIESQIRYVTKAMQMVDRLGAQSITVRRSAQDRFNARIQRKLDSTVWNTGGCRSWYLDEHGKNRTLWAGLAAEYRLATRTVHASEYQLAGAASSTPAADRIDEARPA